MIKVYMLPVERVDNIDKIKGEEYIHNAILECTEEPMVRKLIMDTTPDEDTALSALAIEARDPTQVEIDAYNALEIPTPARDLAAEIDDMRAKLAAAGIPGF